MEKKYEMKERFAVGGYGSVFRGIRRSDGMEVAIKKLVKTDCVMVKAANGKNIPNEVKILQHLKGASGIINMLNYYETQGHYFIVMDKPPNTTNLLEFVKSKKDLKVPSATSSIIINNILKSLILLQDAKVFHSDLKEENVLINTTNLETTIIDFGCSTNFKPGFYYHYSGTLLFAPPEWLETRKYRAEQATVWSLGILTYSLLKGAAPFATENDIKHRQVEFDENFNASSKDFITRLLKKNPEERPRLAQLGSLPWLK